MVKFNNVIYTDKEWGRVSSAGEVDENLILTNNFFDKKWNETLIRAFVRKEIPYAEIIEIKDGSAVLRVVFSERADLVVEMYYTLIDPVPIASYEYAPEFEFERF